MPEPNRHRRLVAFLAQHRELWHPAPFREERPPWCADHPALTRALLALDAATVNALADDDRCREWLTPYLPDLPAIEALTRVAAAEPSPTAAPPHWDWQVPGRKLAQVEAFAAAIGTPSADVVEWCCGLGHLGRRLAATHPIDSIDRDPELCRDGAALARRSGARQRFHVADVMDADLRGLLTGRHALALHACGELHRRLVGESIAAGAAALDLAPCCFHLGGAEVLRIAAGDSVLDLDRDDRRLAVTGTATASPREIAASEHERAWKLGFLCWRQAVTGEHYRPFRPIPKAWLRGGFGEFVAQIGRREGIVNAAALDPALLAECERHGQLRAAEVARLSLPRFAFRRALEVLLGLDIAATLKRAGYDATLRSFCAPALTPRNLLISARR